MEVHVLPENLAKASTMLARVTPSRSTLPILSHLLLATKHGRLAISASDLDIGAVLYIGAQVLEEGAITLPAKLLAKMISKMPKDGKLVLTTATPTKGQQTQTATFQQDGRNLTLEGYDAEDFPPIPPPGETIGEVGTEEFLATLKRVGFCAATNDSRPTITGVYMEAKDDLLTLTATDGFLLGSYHLDYRGEDFTALVRADSLAKAAKLLKEDNPHDPLRIARADKGIHLLGRNMDIAIQKIAGTFPDYTQIVPDSHNTRVTVNRKDFLRELDVCLALVGAGLGRIRIFCTRSDAKLLLKVDAEPEGTYDAALDAAIEGETNKIALNGRYLRDMLSVMDADTVTIDLQDQSHPAVLFDSEEGAYVLMSMAVEW